ncbi:hypothetical protein DIPPA_24493 [Diplonema papillatum]|nr:hypothetical protein DIPPA_24493 [Diplonema papillatum]
MELTLTSYEKLFWLSVFILIVLFRTVFQGFFVRERLQQWLDLSMSPAAPEEPGDDMQSELAKARAAQAKQHQEALDARAGARAEEARAAAVKAAQERIRREKRIHGELSDDENDASGPPKDAPHRGPNSGAPRRPPRTGGPACGPDGCRPR